MIATVLDSNIVVSRYLSPSGAPGRVYDAAESKRFEIVVSDELLAEYRSALQKPRVAVRHRMTEGEITHILNVFRGLALVVTPTPPYATAAPDPKDNMVLDCAVAGGADYIVTGDLGLLKLEQYQGIRIITAVEFLDILEREERAN